MAKIAAFYYSQTGQGLDILCSVCRPLQEQGHEVIYKEIIPKTKFPYPWSADAFFEAFPECREGIGCEIEPLDLSNIQDAVLMLLVHPPWFLSPCIPIHGFFQTKEIQDFLKHRPVVSICGCRNMWIKAHAKIKEYLLLCQGRLVGNIVLQDRHHNLVSVLTIVRWLLSGKKEPWGLFPAAGVSDKDIAGAKVFGEIIGKTFISGWGGLQEKLLAAGAIKYKPTVAFIESAGHRIFGIWSKWVLKKGAYAAPERAFRLKFFKYYLFTVLYLVSPIGLLFFYLAYPFRYKAIKKHKKWFKFFLTGVIETAKDGISTFDAILQLQKTVYERLKKMGARGVDAKKVIDELYTHPITDVSKVAHVIEKSNVSAYKIIADLEKLEILQEITGSQRRRIYVFKEYMDLF